MVVVGTVVDVVVVASVVEVVVVARLVVVRGTVVGAAVEVGATVEGGATVEVVAVIGGVVTCSEGFMAAAAAIRLGIRTRSSATTQRTTLVRIVGEATLQPVVVEEA